MSPTIRGAHVRDAGEDSRQDAAQVTERQGAIDFPRRSQRQMMFGSEMDRQSVDVVADRFRADIPVSCVPGQARRVLDV